MPERTNRISKIFLKKGDIVYYKHDPNKKYECCQDEFRGYVPITFKGNKYNANWDGTYNYDQRVKIVYSKSLEIDNNLTKFKKRKNILDDILINDRFFTKILNIFK